MDLKSRHDAFEASITKFEVDGRTAWHLEILEDGELVFDCNTSLEECLD
jgi:hypothetical protein